MKVTASGSQMKSHINDVLVWSRSDAAYSSGAVGIGMCRGPTSAGDRLWVDWAELGTVVVTATRAEVTDSGTQVGGDRNIIP